MAEEKWFNSEVIKIQDETETVKRFWLRVPDRTSFDFRAGQFVTMDLPIHEKKNKRWRSYSIASAPDGSNVIELVIVYVPDGLGTNYLWKNINEGSTILLRGPLGFFNLPDEIDRDVCFICTGTGIAPFRSMILDLQKNLRPHQNIFLLFGTRYIKDVLYYKELQELDKQIEKLNYHTVLSREDSLDYAGRKGYVHAVYEEIFADKRPAYFYLCGWRNMVTEARTRLANLGYDKKSVHVELYD
jgi:ferredoxin-NADP reductase